MEIQKNETGLYETTIDDRRYEIQKWGAETSVEILVKLVHIVGKPLSVAIGSLASKDSGEVKLDLDQEIDLDLVALILDAMTTRLDDKLVLMLLKKLTSENVLCDGKKINFNTHFQDDLMHMFKVAKTALEVQYGNFLVALLGFVGTSSKKGLINQA